MSLNDDLIDHENEETFFPCVTKKKYPNKLGRIAPEIFWFADRFEK